jgi:hypothetical protein
MSFIGLNSKIARLIILQRTELAPPTLVKIRKFFGRYLFTNFISKFLISKESINSGYYDLMKQEYILLKNYVEFDNKNILSIGSGVCGLELIINKNEKNSTFAIIEKNYVSKKVKYGWDNNNLEAYNNLKLLKNFLIRNKMENNFEIYDFDQDNFPNNKFDIIISLYSLDYHYDFNIYIDYLKKVFSDNTIIIFDTIRPEYFSSIFQKVKIISSDKKNIHSSKRIICSKFIN